MRKKALDALYNASESITGNSDELLILVCCSKVDIFKQYSAQARVETALEPEFRFSSVDVPPAVVLQVNSYFSCRDTSTTYKNKEAHYTFEVLQPYFSISNGICEQQFWGH